MSWRMPFPKNYSELSLLEVAETICFPYYHNFLYSSSKIVIGKKGDGWQMEKLQGR